MKAISRKSSKKKKKKDHILPQKRLLEEQFSIVTKYDQTIKFFISVEHSMMAVVSQH